MNSGKKITTGEIKHIADLARLPIREQDLAKFQKELAAILDLFRKLKEIETEGVIPTSQVTGLENVLRSDEVRPSIPQKTVLSNAPRTHKGYFLVEAIFY